MKEVFDRHEKAALQFSGGKDSLACLWLIEPWWSKTTIVWVNTGASFPGNLERIEKVRALVPHFKEVKSDQEKIIAEFGYPVDVLPIMHHESAIPLGAKKPKMQSFIDCCWKNVMWPAYQGVKETGATLLIRGQKAADSMRGPLPNGTLIDGLEILHPIDDWTDEDVKEFLIGTPFGIPPHYEHFNSSLECWSCTAYLHDTGRLKYLRKFHPLMHKEVSQRLQEIEVAINMNDYTGRALSA